MELITNFDYNTLYWIHNNLSCNFLNFFMPIFTTLGNAGILWIVFALILISNKRYRKYGFIMLLALLLGTIISDLILKNVVCRLRPFYTYDFGKLLINPPSGFSFPSGHTVASFTSAYVAMKANKKLGVLAYILAAIMGFSRLYLCVHYPTDVLGGIVVGTLVAMLAVALYNYFCTIMSSKRKKTVQ